MSAAQNVAAPGGAHLVDLATCLARPVSYGWMHPSIANVVLILAADRAGIAGDRLAEAANFLGRVAREASH